MLLKVDDVLLPTLEALRDGKRAHSSEIRERVAADLNLTDAEQRERAPSAPYPRFENLVAWALVHLGKGKTGAGLLEKVAPGVYSLTVSGSEFLTNPHRQLSLRSLHNSRHRSAL